MKKKILSLFLVMAFVAVAAISSTLAYFTDTDHAHNVFLVGDVDVELIEQQRDTDGKLVDYVNDKPLLPAVYNGTPYADSTLEAPNGAVVPIYDATVNNEQDKVVSVLNTGDHGAYVRVIFAVEDVLFDDGTYLTDYVHLYFNPDSSVGEVEWLTDASGKRVLVSLTDNGVAATYSICTYTYKMSVNAESYTPASLVQVYLDPKWNNACSHAVGKRFDILAVAQAVQSDGFNDFSQALFAAFGEVDAASCADWFVFVGDDLTTK